MTYGRICSSVRRRALLSGTVSEHGPPQKTWHSHGMPNNPAGTARPAAHPSLVTLLIAAALLPLLLSGCGQKGPLYLPPRNGTVITRPAAPTPAPTDAAQDKDKDKTDDTPAPPR